MRFSGTTIPVLSARHIFGQAICKFKQLRTRHQALNYSFQQHLQRVLVLAQR
jgi:hypothetical protein